MAISTWRPFGSVDRWERGTGLSDIQAEMNRLFDSFFGRAVPMTVVERAWTPAVDVYETEEALVLMAEVPGVSEKDISLSITGELLTVRGERRSPEEIKPDRYYRAERWFGKFERTIGLPFPVQADRVQATYRDGVLKVSLPKAEELRPKEIKINVV
jgi:HSP20 family protein